jgi:hypothetical protein
MATLQVKRFPDNLHEALARRARSEGVTMSAFVTAQLLDALSRPSAREWIQRLNAQLPVDGLPDLDASAALDEARSAYDLDSRARPA